MGRRAKEVGAIRAEKTETRNEERAAAKLGRQHRSPDDEPEPTAQQWRCRCGYVGNRDAVDEHQARHGYRDRHSDRREHVQARRW
jgi:hypothetical protein